MNNNLHVSTSRYCIPQPVSCICDIGFLLKQKIWLRHANQLKIEC